MQMGIREVLEEFKASTAGQHLSGYEDQIVDGDVDSVNRSIPYILRELLDEGDSLHELAPMQSPTPFYAWFRKDQTSSVGVETVAGSSAGTTAIRFKLLDVRSLEELLHALVLPLFTRRPMPIISCDD